MAKTWEARRLEVERRADRRMNAALGDLAESVGFIVQRYSQADPRTGKRLIPKQQSTRVNLRAAIWRDAVKPFFVGAGDEPMDGARPLSPYTRLVVGDIGNAIRVQAERQVAIVQKYATDPVVLNWLTGPRPQRLREIAPPVRTQYMVSLQGSVVGEIGGGDRRRWYDPFHSFVGPDGYTLSDRVWRTGIDVRSRIDRLLDYHIPRGEAAVDIARLLLPYLNPEAGRIRTRTPYGRVGSYAARRLARTEITAAAGRSALNMAMVNPWVEGCKWNLSPSHPRIDICDDHAGGGPGGDGVYEPGNFPLYPAHPHCLCYITFRVVRNPAQVVAQLREEIRQSTLYAQELQGAFNLEWLVAALMAGGFVNFIERLSEN